MNGAGEWFAPVKRKVSARDIVMGAAASRDWQRQHHDIAYARSMNLPDIIMNAPTQTGWFHAYAMDWAGPGGRIARWRLKMRRSICPGAEVVLSGKVDHVEANIDWPDVEWVWLGLVIDTGGERLSEMALLLARPRLATGDCWDIPTEKWCPPPLAR
ncbi:hypothetical protein MB02_00070 [Croceicoccus estronivorus]|uniref:hypothetical protein n=1 Tax=Croceicoccus estronivorus TaxID=1172626 RepID=UPI00082D8D5A|nr:hypothetical protein [Croceicoccus estronivorus]OCC25132.1 hypothetical protein MB02_00070 [Croceicoccus estronivorus]